MTDTQKRVLGWVGIAVLLAAAAFVVALVVQLRTGGHLDRSDLDNISLSFLWRQAATLIGLGATASAIFSAALAIVTIAVGIVAQNYGRTPQITGLVVVCALGLAAAFILVSETNPRIGEAVNEIRYYGGLEGDTATVAKQIHAFAYGLIGWFGLYAAAMLGVKVADRNGAVQKFLRLGDGGPPRKSVV